MNRTFLYQYKKGSKSAREFARALGVKRIKLQGSKFKPRPNKTIINWGSSSLPDEYLSCKIINNPENVALAANKLHFFNRLSAFNEADNMEAEISYPEFTTDKAVAQQWLDDGKTVMERHKLTGNSGQGIVVCEPDGELGDAPLYTMYVPKKYEYRIHVKDGQVIDRQRKARNRDVPDEEIDWKIRNHDGGFIFARNEDHVPPPVVDHQAILAVRACGLDFGAVDVIYNDKREKAYVLEVNTAPGLTGTTLENYVEAFGG